MLVGGSTGPAKEGLTMGWTMALSRLSPGIVVPSELATRARRKGRRGELSSVPPPICLADHSTAIPLPVRSLPAFSRVEIASISAVSKIATRWAPPLRPLSPEEL